MRAKRRRKFITCLVMIDTTVPGSSLYKLAFFPLNVSHKSPERLALLTQGWQHHSTDSRNGSRNFAFPTIMVPPWKFLLIFAAHTASALCNTTLSFDGNT